MRKEIDMKVIFFDIDGTLISDETKVMPESTKQAIEQARANGHICMINSGRTKRLVIGSISELAPFDGYVLGCGTMVLLNGNAIFHKVFSEEFGQHIVERLLHYKIDAVLEGEENIYQQPMEKIFYKEFYDFMLGFLGKNVGSYEEAIGKFDKFYCYTEHPEDMEAFCEEFKDTLTCIDREKGYYEVLPKGSSKGEGIKMVAEYLHIPMEDTVAIGDSNNDREMLLTAGTSIAMGNATEGIKELADYVTTTVEDDGIANALKWLGVI